MMDKPSSSARVFGIFLRLGATSFGGPVAHLAVFHRFFVERRGWVSSSAFAEWLALCQSLPGPTSSQLGMRIGLHLGGLPGAFAAWLGFTLPGALLLGAAGWLLPVVSGGERATHGLKVFAVSVVAHAVWTMGRSLCPDAPRLAIGALGLAICAAWPGAWGQILAIAGGAILGWAATKRTDPPANPPGTGSGPARGWPFLLAFAGLFPLLVGIAAGTEGRLWTLVDGLYRSGALVFGGGHVVLPLLRENVALPLGIPDATFLWGYGLAQAMPGPLFNMASFLGAAGFGPGGAVLAACVVFLPGALVLGGVLPFWEQLRRREWFRAALPGVNAAVVGILAAALVGPVGRAGVGTLPDLLLAAGGIAVLLGTRVPVWLLAVAMTAAAWFLLP